MDKKNKIHYYIHGSATNPEKVINTLKKLGGVCECHDGSYENAVYYINSVGNINYAKIGTTLYDMLIEFGECVWPEPDFKYSISEKVIVDNNVYLVKKCINNCGKPAYILKDYLYLLDESELKPYTAENLKNI